MADQLRVCILEVEDLRLQVLAIRQTSEKYKGESTIKFRQLDQLHVEYQELRKRFNALRLDVSSAAAAKGKHAEHAVLEADNVRIRENLRKCEETLDSSRIASKDLHKHIDVIKHKLAVENVDVSSVKLLEGAVGDLDERIDLDKIWDRLSETFTFKSQKDCEIKVTELTVILRSVMSAHEKMKVLNMEHFASGDKLYSQFTELRREYDKLREVYATTLHGVDTRAFRLIAENEKLRERLTECSKALAHADSIFRNLSSQYAEFKARWEPLRIAQLEERKLRVAELRKVAGQMGESLEDLESASASESHERVRFSPSAKKTSDHKVLTRPPRR